MKERFKMIKLIFAFLWLFPSHAETIPFNEAVERLNSHKSLKAIRFQSKAIQEEARLKGSWGDPQFKIHTKNFPRDTLSFQQSPMTGIEFGLSQKLALTDKYGNREEAFQSLSRAYRFSAKDKKSKLTKALWEILILKRKLTEELFILNENKTWISKILKVSKRLYATGKLSQQALLDIQIRKSEIESEISNKKYELSQAGERLKYLIGSADISQKSIPWKLLELESKKLKDNKELSLKEELKAKQLQLKVAKLNYIPDLTLSLGYTKRFYGDGSGDFIGGSILFPLPFSKVKYSKHKKALQESRRAVENYEDYKNQKKRDISVLSQEIKKIISEIHILKQKTIKFARNSRQITSKSYGLGNSSYIELLQSELKLQEILMHKVQLEAKRDVQRVTLKYIKGESLNE